LQNLKWIFEQRGLPYDAILMLSGGKDSVLALYDIVNSCDAKVLAITYDDGFLDDTAIKNIKTITITNHLKTDSMTLRKNMLEPVETFLKTDLIRSVDLNTFTEVFQCYFWKIVSDISTAFGGVPVVTGNIGYFSSEELLPEQWTAATNFARSLNVDVPSVNDTFISYWAEEPYTINTSLLMSLGWESNEGLSTEHSWLKEKRKKLNEMYPKKTLDNVIEQQYGYVTSPKFQNKMGKND
jgi:hypothetical protein